MTNTFRKQYRALTDEEKKRLNSLKDWAEVLEGQLTGGDPRAMALARTKLEECVMWAVKALT